MSVASTVVSFFTYFQNLGCTISLPSIQVPEELRTVLDAVRNFLAFIQSLIPSIPPFDIRAQLIILTVVFPLVLDIIFVWFVQPFATTVFHIIDVAAMFSLFMFIAQGVLKKWTIVCILVTVATALWSFIRLIYILFNGSSSTFGLVQIARNVCNHYLYNITPGIQKELTVQDLNNIIQRFSKVVEIRPKPTSVPASVFKFFFATLLLIVALWALDVIPIPIVIPPALKLIMPTVALIFSFLFYMSFLLKLCACGRKFGMAIKQFCKRWGLRLLMMALELLYIPILSIFASLLVFSKDSSCDIGFYRKNDPSSFNNSVDLLVHHESQCVKCSIDYGQCYKFCRAKEGLRMADDPSLLFVDDVLKVSGGFIIYVIFFVMFGIPVLWYYIIQRNKAFAYNVNIYGQDPESKWLRLVNRMKTTGIFLFVNYKFNTSRWAVFYLGVKFLVMMITTIAGRIWVYLTFLLPLFYLIVLVCIVYYRPYLYTFNNVLDGILYFTQIAFSVIPTMSFFNVVLPDTATIPLSIIVCGVPVVSIIFLLFFKRKSVDFEQDPTYPESLTEEEEEALDKKRRNAKRRNERRKKAKMAQKNGWAKNASLSDDDNDPFILRKKQKIYPVDEPEATVYVGDPPSDQNSNEYTQQFIEDFSDSEAEILIVEDEATINPGDLCTVEESIRYRKQKKVSPDFKIEGEPFVVNKRVIANRMTSMYEMLDIVVDGSTIDFLTTVLNVAINFAIAALGWYVGALFFTGDLKPICN